MNNYEQLERVVKNIDTNFTIYLAIVEPAIEDCKKASETYLLKKYLDKYLNPALADLENIEWGSSSSEIGFGRKLSGLEEVHLDKVNSLVQEYLFEPFHCSTKYHQKLMNVFSNPLLDNFTKIQEVQKILNKPMIK